MPKKKQSVKRINSKEWYHPGDKKGFMLLLLALILVILSTLSVKALTKVQDQSVEDLEVFLGEGYPVNERLQKIKDEYKTCTAGCESVLGRSTDGRNEDQENNAANDSRTQSRACMEKCRVDKNQAIKEYGIENRNKQDDGDRSCGAVALESNATGRVSENCFTGVSIVCSDGAKKDWQFVSKNSKGEKSCTTESGLEEIAEKYCAKRRVSCE